MRNLTIFLAAQLRMQNHRFVSLVYFCSSFKLTLGFERSDWVKLFSRWKAIMKFKSKTFCICGQFTVPNVTDCPIEFWINVLIFIWKQKRFIISTPYHLWWSVQQNYDTIQQQQTRKDVSNPLNKDKYYEGGLASKKENYCVKI